MVPMKGAVSTWMSSENSATVRPLTLLVRINFRAPLASGSPGSVPG
jgi:hypothetical protein